MFAAAMRLRKTQPDHPRGYRAPALGLLCTVGLLASIAALAIGFVPPHGSAAAASGRTSASSAAGLAILGLLIPLAFLKLRRPDWSKQDGGETA